MAGIRAQVIMAAPDLPVQLCPAGLTGKASQVFRSLPQSIVRDYGAFVQPVKAP